MLETVVAVVIFTLVGTAVLAALSTAHTSGARTESQSIAENLARNQMEDAFCRAYQEPDSTYPSIAPRVGHTVVAEARKYAGYDPAKGQEIVVTVSRDGEAVMILVTLRTRE